LLATAAGVVADSAIAEGRGGSEIEKSATCGSKSLYICSIVRRKSEGDFSAGLMKLSQSEAKSSQIGNSGTERWDD